MPRILPELESYQVRLEERAQSWDEKEADALHEDLAQCDQQVRLLEKGIKEFSAALDAIPPSLVEERRRAEHRIDVLSQTRDLTAAYAIVLRAYISRKGKA